MTDKRDGLYILMLSIHGLVRGSDIELGRDADTGGQVKYVVELARALAEHDAVGRVDLVTRKVVDERVAADYARDVEPLSPGAAIIRLEAGPRRYIRKELLWEHLESFADRALRHVRSAGRVPDVIHSHYADAGYAGAILAGVLGVPLVHTGHSLGRIKRARLLEQGLDADRIERRYNMEMRIEAEELALDTAALVIASTRQEVEEQYALYDNYRSRRMSVIPPGVDLSRFRPPARGEAPPAIARDVDRFLADPRKPLVLAMSRPDSRKNAAALVRAFAGSETLRATANLALVLGNRDRVRDMEREPREVFAEIFELIDDHDLYGSIAYPKHHQPDDVPDLYRLAAARRGLFVNPALTEPFGLTILEAAASGVPVVATRDGGPSDILAKLDNGVLIDPLDAGAMGAAILDGLADAKRWRRWSANGVRGAARHFSWKAHVETYLREVDRLMRPRPGARPIVPTRNRLPVVRRLIVTDIDDTLLGDDLALRELLELLERHAGDVGLAVATGRHIDSAREALEDEGVPLPDLWITSVGSEIHYGRERVADTAWKRHIDYRWQPDAVRELLDGTPGLKLQGPGGQRPHKISYDVDGRRMPSVRKIAGTLRRHGIAAKLIYSRDAYLDVLPIRASKGRAVRYIALKWGLPFESILVAGDSGNDEEMLACDAYAVVVGNHSPELARLRGRPRVHFADACFAGGILEAVHHYEFLAAADADGRGAGADEKEEVLQE